jgi:hypothetical protein
MFAFSRKTSKAKAEKNGDFLQNPKILEVNLVKDQALIPFDWNKRLLELFLVLALAAALVGEIYFGLSWWETQEMSKAQNLDAQTAQTNAEVAQLKNQVNAALAYKAKSADFSALVANHIYWTNFFSWLEKNTLTTVKYDGFSGDLTGAYNLTATTQTYADVSWQVKAFLNDPLTQKAEVLSAAAAKSADRTKPSSVSFGLALQVDPRVFRK